MAKLRSLDHRLTMKTFTKFIGISILGLSLNFLPQQINNNVTATTTNYSVDYQQLEADILREMNKARTNPQGYITDLQQYKTYFDGKIVRLPGQTDILTREGKTAVNEAIANLRQRKPIKPLKISTGMSRGARDHVFDQSRTGQLGHTGSDGSQPHQRIDRYGKWQQQSAENISYGPTTGKQVVMSLIVDDGVSDRGHRENIFNPAYRVTGIACGQHPRYRVVCVTNFAAGYTEK